jgi:hypothetical protein
MNWETYGQHISFVIEGEEIIPLVSPLLGGQGLDKNVEPQWEACRVCGKDHWTKDHPYIYEGMELTPTPKPKIVFGIDVLCYSCKGTGHETPMSNGEKAERRRHKLQGIVHARWVCQRCMGRGLSNVND